MAQGYGTAGPFKAAQSYGPADGDLFHGRDAEAALLAQFLADRELAVLAAPSGMGKTSLLHAKVLPKLESEHWLTVYARPEDHPLKSLQAALADQLLPDPRVEATVVDHLSEVLCEETPADDGSSAAPSAEPVRLEAALARYRGLPHARRVALRLLMPPTENYAAPLPMICRALRGSIDVNDLIEHFEAMVAEGPAMGLTPQTPLADMASLLRHKKTVDLWEEWRRRLETADGLEAALAILDNDWAPLRPGLTSTLLVLDQFEEVFTRLRPGTVENLLSETGKCFASRTASSSGRPLHVALSMRKEFFADLVPFLQPFGSVERLTFFLRAMPADQARNAFSKPAKDFGLEFEEGRNGRPDCLDHVLALALDDGAAWVTAANAAEPEDLVSLPAGRRFAPTVISLIGAHLWARLEERKRDGAPVGMPLSWSDFQALVPHLDDVFASLLADALDQLEQSQEGGATRFDALELLDRLATSAGYRNIIAEDQLVDQLPLNRQAAQQLLDDMDRKVKVVRRESRRGGRFVEIMHERLIPPVRRLLAEARRRDILRANLGPAHDMLYVLPDEPDVTKDPLPSYFREALVYYIDRLSLDGLAAKNLLRSLLVAGPPDGEGRAGAAPESQNRWKSALRRLACELDRPQEGGVGRNPLLTGGELDAAISRLRWPDGTPGSDTVRHVALSALADRTELAGERILSTFGAIAALRYQL